MKLRKEVERIKINENRVEKMCCFVWMDRNKKFHGTASLLPMETMVALENALTYTMRC